MKIATLIWIIVASLLVLAGLILFVSVMISVRWNFNALSTSEYETNTYSLTEGFNSISVTSDTSDVSFLISEDDRVTVKCHDQKNLRHTVSVKDGVLTVEVNDSRKWYERIGINFGSPRVTVYLPKGEYGDLSVKLITGDVSLSSGLVFDSVDVSTTTGDVRLLSSVAGDVKINTTTGSIDVEGISAGSLRLSLSTGKVSVTSSTVAGNVGIEVTTGKARLSALSCGSLTTDGNTGDVTLSNVIATGTLSVKRTTGDVTLEACDAAEISVRTDTGDVKGTLRTEKIFIIDTSTGKRDVPKTASGGRCEITTTTGDIIISIAEKVDGVYS